jgi:hypothetical protein
MSLHGRQYAFTHLVGNLPLTTPMSATWNVHGTGALNPLKPFDELSANGGFLSVQLIVELAGQ